VLDGIRQIEPRRDDQRAVREPDQHEALDRVEAEQVRHRGQQVYRAADTQRGLVVLVHRFASFRA
jgi:hypothetical protein